MQSRLPDVNTAFIKHRNGAIEGLGSKNFDKVFGSLYSWNALLPRTMLEDEITPKYRVLISDLLFKEKTQIKTEAICTNSNCQDKQDFDNIKILLLLTPLVEGILSGEPKQKIWICSKCKAECKLSETIITETRLKEPYFLGIVPKPPSRKDGLNDRFSYGRKVTQWAWNFISELEEKSTQFREDYRENKIAMEGDWEEDIEGGEEKDNA